MVRETPDFPSMVSAFLRTAARPLIVVVGPTASGKTAFSIELAQSLIERDPEIVNADSRQLYRFLDIGTAKVKPEEMQGIRHHLIGVLDPTEEVTAAWYKERAHQVIDDIHRKNGLPMLVGGSMLYLSAIIDGLAFPQSSDSLIRQKLEAEYDLDQGKSLHRRLTERDPEEANRIPRQNKPYLVRAMEIVEVTGERPSSIKSVSACPYDLFIVGIERPREDLTRRINHRTQELIDGGWIDEVRDLLRRGYTADDPGMKSHGYREIMAFLQNKETDIHSLTETIAARTRQYAKRQRTWWKNDERIHWIQLSDHA